MDNLTQLGISGLTLSILFFIVRYFIQAMDKKDNIIQEQQKELANLTIRSIEVTNKFTEALAENTTTVKLTADVTKTHADSLTKLIMKVIKTK